MLRRKRWKDAEEVEEKRKGRGVKVQEEREEEEKEEPASTRRGDVERTERAEEDVTEGVAKHSARVKER